MWTNIIADTKYILDYWTKLLQFTNANKSYYFNSWKECLERGETIFPVIALAHSAFGIFNSDC